MFIGKRNKEEQKRRVKSMASKSAMHTANNIDREEGQSQTEGWCY